MESELDRVRQEEYDQQQEILLRDHLAREEQAARIEEEARLVEQEREEEDEEGRYQLRLYRFFYSDPDSDGEFSPK